MVTRLVVVDDFDDDDRDESAVPRRDQARYIRGAERRRLVLELARGRKKIVDIAKDFDRAPQTISNFKHYNKREIQEMDRVLMERTADLAFYEQHMRMQSAEEHLHLINDQIRLMLDAADREDDPTPLDLKEFRGLMAEANKIRKELREELKPTLSLGDVTITPLKGYGGKEWFGEPEKDNES